MEGIIIYLFTGLVGWWNLIKYKSTPLCRELTFKQKQKITTIGIIATFIRDFLIYNSMKNVYLKEGILCVKWKN